LLGESRQKIYQMTTEAITISLLVSIGSVQKEHVLLVEWLRDKLAEAETAIPPIKGPIEVAMRRFVTVPPQSLSKRARALRSSVAKQKHPLAPALADLLPEALELDPAQVVRLVAPAILASRN
jgi:hypothetical protein